MIAAPACAPSACRAHTQDTCRPMYAVVRTVSEQVLWREHAALAQKLSKKIPQGMAQLTSVAHAPSRVAW